MTPAFFPAIAPVRFATPRPICAVVIDAEEDFDWDNPIQGTLHSTEHLKNIRVLHEILAAYGIVTTYLLTYPVLDDADVVRIIRRQLERGHCAAGIQLHPWVTPPFDNVRNRRTSFSGNIDATLEEKKLVALKTRFAETFGFDPTVYRAGRYGLSNQSAHLLEQHGFRIDTSVAPRTSFAAEGGPDYTGYDYELFWFGRHRRLLEVPLCRSIVGWSGAGAPSLYRRVSGPQMAAMHIPSMLTRSRCAERITLSPEGNDIAAMRRLVHGLLARGQQVFALSFHSSSLQAGRNPYVQSKADLHAFYDRLSATLDYLATSLDFRFAGIQDIPDLLAPPPPANA